MNYIKISVLSCFFCSFLALNAQNSGSIIGNISDHQGQPLEFVSISLKGTNIGTATDQTGTFELRRVLSDDYTLVVSYVGFHTEVRQITVMPNQTTTVPTIILTPNMQELEGVVVSSAAQIFAEKKSETVARLPIANLENSQVYTVVPKELLKEQMTSDFRTALMSSPGVTNVVLGVGSGGTGLSMRMRGFSGADGAGSIRNGMATNFVSLSDPVNLERLEIIKGPSSTLFGSTLISYGGLVNRVTKKPLGYQSTELSFSAGSYGLGRVTLDYNTSLNKDNTFLFRFNTAIHRENSFQDQGINRTYMIAPAFSYIVNENLKINMDLEFFKTKRNSTYVGLTPSAGISNFDQLEWDFKRSYASNDITSTAEVLNVFANAEYTLDEHWTSDTRVSYSNTDNNANYLFLLVKAGEGAYQGEHLLQRRLMNLPSNFNTTQIQQNLTGIHQWGNVSNKFLVGVDYTQLTTTDSRTMINDYDALNDQVTVLNQDAPVINVNTYQTALSQTNRAANHRDTQTYSVYISDVLTLYDRLNLMVGLRFDRFHDRANDYLQSAWSPKTGLVYQLIPDQLSAFINYQNGFRNVAPSTLSDDTRLVFSPEQANQIETGFKFELLNGKINGTVSYYDIKVKDRVRSVFDENNEYISVQDGTQTSKGVEFDIIANPFEGFHIIMGYGYNDSRFEKVDADMEDISGRHPLATPMNSANYWASYKFSQGSLEGFGLGIGGNYSGDYYFDDLNTITIDGFHTLNASIFYEQSKFRIGLKMNNLTDQQYWSAAYWAVPQKTRTILANISFKF